MDQDQDEYRGGIGGKCGPKTAPIKELTRQELEEMRKPLAISR